LPLSGAAAESRCLQQESLPCGLCFAWEYLSTGSVGLDVIGVVYGHHPNRWFGNGTHSMVRRR
jgi:hypothetical protein